MPYNTIDGVFVKQYADTYVALLEQKESKLLSKVTNIGEVVGTSFTVNEYGSLGDVDTAITRFGATQYTDASFASRLAIQDFPRLKANPQDKMLQGLHAKWNRKVDRVIYNALIGNAARKTVGADT